jgi:quinol monooxygenase YgiN
MNRRRRLRILSASPFLFLSKSDWPAQSPPQREQTEMELFIFARFHARPGKEIALRETLLEVHTPTRQDAGYLSHDVYHSVRDPQLFYIYSRRKDGAAFNTHVELPHTVRFVEQVERLIDHSLEVTRAEQITR